MNTNTSSSLMTSPDPTAIDAVGNNIALIFAAAKESGQSEAVVREAIAILGNMAHPQHQRMETSSQDGEAERSGVFALSQTAPSSTSR